MRISHYVAVLDACVLAPMPVADTVLRLAQESFFTPAWSDQILAETRRTLEKFGYSHQQSQRRTDTMMKAFPEALVSGYEDLVPSMKNDEKDRHVLAAAVRVKAHCIVTNNKKHFPPAILAPYDLECVSADEFLEHQYHLDVDGFIQILMQQAFDTRQSISQLLASLSPHVPGVSNLISPRLSP